MNKSGKVYAELSAVEKRIYEQSFCNLLSNPHMNPITKEEVHEICMGVVECWEWVTNQGKPYNPAD
jgi:hypothetical protein